MKEILNSKIGNPETIESIILFKCFQLSRTSFVSFELWIYVLAFCRIRNTYFSTC